MKNHKTIIWISMAVALVVTVILVAVALPSKNLPEITLPDGSDSGKDDMENSDIYDSEIAQVSTDTVQVVIENLHRSDSYVRSIEITDYSPTDTSQITMDIYVKGSRYRIFQRTESGTKNCLVIDDEFWIWYDNSREYLQGSLESSDYSQVDALMRTISYEQLLEIPKSDINEAKFVDYNGEGCIYAEYETGRLRYTYSVYVSVSTGLLMAAEKHDGQELIYSMVSKETSISTPEDDFFLPPSNY